jgi:hypothetical protein
MSTSFLFRRLAFAPLRPVLVALLLAFAASIVSGPSHAQDCAHYEEHMHWVGVITEYGSPRSFATAGSQLYVATGTDVHILDVSDPIHPVLLGTVTPTGSASDVAVSGSLLFVAGNSGLEIFDVQNPAQPVRLGSAATSLPAINVALTGSLACLTDWDGFSIIDVSDPTAPTLLSWVKTNHIAYAVDAADGFAYVGGPDPAFNWVYQRTSIVDLQDPSNPVVVATMWPGGTAVAIDGKLAYLGRDFEGISGSVRVYDVSNPASPAHLGGFGTQTPVTAVTVQEGRAYVGTYWIGLQVWDVSNPSNATPLGTMYGGGGEVAVIDDFAYAASGDGIHVVALLNPAPVPPIGSVPMGPNFSFEIAVHDRYVYSGSLDTLMVVDATVPASPTNVARLHTAGGVRGMTVVGDHAYVAKDDAGLLIADVTNPHQPLAVASSPLGGRAYDVSIQGDFAYVTTVGTSTEDPRLVVLDVSNPAVPVIVGQVSFQDASQPLIAVRGNHVYVTTGSGSAGPGVQVFDVTDPALPVSVGFLLIQGARSIAAHEDLLLVGEGGAFRVFDLANPTAPALIGVIPSLPTSGQISTRGDLAYTSGWIIDLADPSAPEVVGSVVGARWLGGIERRGASAVDDFCIYGSGGEFYSSIAEVKTFPLPCATATAIPPHDPPLVSALAPRLHSAPNPTPGQVDIELQVPAAGDGQLAIYGATGRRIRELLQSRLETGQRIVRWDGRSDSGQLVPNGVYWVRLSWMGRSTAEKLVVLR